MLFKSNCVLFIYRRLSDVFHSYHHLLSEYGNRGVRRGLREEGSDLACVETGIAANAAQQHKLRQRGYRFRFLLAGTPRFPKLYAESQGLTGTKAFRHQRHSHHQTTYSYASDFLSTGKTKFEESLTLMISDELLLLS